MINENTRYCTAIFTPLSSDDLKRNSATFAGKRLKFHKGFTIDRGDYVGDFAMWCDDLLGWVPSRELTDIVVTEEWES